MQFGRGVFTEPWPTTTLVAWGTFGGVFFGTVIVWSLYLRLSDKKKEE